ncbi:hypothetical protein J7K27_01390 [Candidatus Bathyarchaeota archaeon]|nr:hypothetical protein [Candidatus Bathyarchaeota archaeon]
MKPKCRECRKFRTNECFWGFDGVNPDSEACEEFEPKKAEAPQTVYAPFVELSNGVLAEECYDPDEEIVYYTLYNPKHDDIGRLPSIRDGEVVYKPIESEEIKDGLVLLPSDPQPYGNDKQLFNDIINFLDSWHEAPTRRDRKLDALYCMLTWIFDCLPRVPYRRMLGALGRGKSAWLEALGSICYRGVILSGCDTDKAIVRRLHKWRGTALIDEADFNDSSLYAFLVKVLNLGYDAKRAFYTRCDDEDPDRTLSYYVYGPKILANRSRYKDAALESRCITTIARENRKPMPLFRMQKFAAQALELRNKLLMWRFDHYHEMKAKAAILETEQINRELGLMHVSSRIKEVVAPIFLVSETLSREEIVNLAYELDQQLLTNPEFELELAFNRALLKILNQAEADGDSGDSGDSALVRAPSSLEAYMAHEGSSESNENYVFKIPLVKIGKTILEDEEPDVNELKKFNYKLAKMIRNRLGFQIVLGHGRKRFVLVPGAYLRTVTTVTQVTMPKQRIIEVGLQVVDPIKGIVEPRYAGPYTAFLSRLEAAKLFWMIKKQREACQSLRHGWKWYAEKNGFFYASKRPYSLKEFLNSFIPSYNEALKTKKNVKGGENGK